MSDRAIPRQQDLQSLFQEGERHFGEGRVAEARACFERITADDPLNDEAFNNLGVIYFQQDALVKALSCFDRALQLRPGREDTVENLVAFTDRLEGSADKEAFYDDVLAADIQGPEALVTICEGALRAGSLQAAGHALNRLIVFHGRAPEVAELARNLTQALQNAREAEQAGR